MPSDKELFAELRYRRSVQPDGSVEYYNEAGLLHREDGPAIVYADNTKVWYQNGVLHREDGPAVVYDDSTCEWWIDGLEYTVQEFHEQLKVLGHTSCLLMQKFTKH